MCAASVATAAPSLEQECNAARAKPKAAPKDNPLAIRLAKSSDPLRKVLVRRYVQCGYKNGKFLRALENVYYFIETQDRGDVQFDTKNPSQTKRYYVECESALPSLDKLVKGATSPIGLSCVHRIYRTDGGADRVTGVDTFKNGPGTLEVLARNGWNITVQLTGEAKNPYETVRVDVQATGALTNSVQVFTCPTKPSKRPTPAPCG